MILYDIISRSKATKAKLNSIFSTARKDLTSDAANIKYDVISAMYIPRTLSNSILEANKYFYVLLLTGPRQVGKTTLLQNLQKDNRTYISLDDLDTRIAANKDPAGFLERIRFPVLIDEIQYAPNLFPYIKMLVDREKKPGLIWLTGSQQFSMMRNISESLAGRVAIFELQGISLAEETGHAETEPFLPTLDVIKRRQAARSTLSRQEVFHRIWQGSYPSVVLSKGKTWKNFYESYITTYIERDIRDYLDAKNLTTFRQFIQVAATRTGQKINFRDISKDIGISEPTIKSWFALLQMAGLVVFLQPYYTNLNKRLIKTPKLYFMDTGLCCFLTKWLNPEVAENGAMAGALLETYVCVEIIKSYIYNGQTPPIYYYADRDQKEIDLLIEANGLLHPIEIKKSSSVLGTNFSHFKSINKIGKPIGHGAVLLFNNRVLPINPEIDIIPISLL